MRIRFSNAPICESYFSGQRLHTMRVREPMTVEDLCQEVSVSVHNHSQIQIEKSLCLSKWLASSKGMTAVIATRSFSRSFSSLTPNASKWSHGQMKAFPCTLLAAAHSPPLLAALAKKEEAVAKGGMMIVGPEGGTCVAHSQVHNTPPPYLQ